MRKDQRRHEFEHEGHMEYLRRTNPAPILSKRYRLSNDRDGAGDEDFEKVQRDWIEYHLHW